MPELPSVSVAVPNFNYAHCLADRMYTIFDQTHPVEEVIVLDDASSDNSVEVIQRVAEERQRDVTLVINDVNSGSVFANGARRPKRRKASLSGSPRRTILRPVVPFDDAADPSRRSGDRDGFLRFAFDRRRRRAGLSSYKAYFATLEPGALSQTEVFEGPEFVRRFLSVKNTILNVSSVLWRRKSLLRCLEACRTELIAISHGRRLAPLPGMPRRAGRQNRLCRGPPQCSPSPRAKRDACAGR